MVYGWPGWDLNAVHGPAGSDAWYTLAGSGSRFEYRSTRLARLSGFSGAFAVTRYTLVTNRMPGGCGQPSSGPMSTEIVVLAPAPKAPGRNPITSCPSSVNAELASLTPSMTLMSRCPELGLLLAPACGGGHVKL